MQRRVVCAVVVAQHGVRGLRVEAVGLELRGRDVEIAAVVAAGEAARELLRAELAGLEPELTAEAVGASSRDDIDDAARVGAVHEPLRAAQDFDAFHVVGREQAVEARPDLRRARIDRLHAVDHQHGPVALFAANSERSRLTRPAAVADPDAGLRAEHVREPVVAPELDIGSIDDRYRRADLSARRGIRLPVTMTSSGRVGCAALDDGRQRGAAPRRTQTERYGDSCDGPGLHARLPRQFGAEGKRGTNWRGSRVTTLLRSAPRLTERELTCPAGLLADRCDSLRLPEARSLSGISQ